MFYALAWYGWFFIGFLLCFVLLISYKVQSNGSNKSYIKVGENKCLVWGLFRAIRVIVLWEVIYRSSCEWAEICEYWFWEDVRFIFRFCLFLNVSDVFLSVWLPLVMLLITWYMMYKYAWFVNDDVALCTAQLLCVHSLSHPCGSGDFMLSVHFRPVEVNCISIKSL